jgi:cytochrome c
MRSLGSIVVAAAVAATLAGCGRQSDTAKQDSHAQASSSEQPATTALPQPAPSEAEKQALLASLPAPYNTADVKNGESKFALCRSCHTITPGGPNMTGPNLHGVFGAKAASKPGYRYSDALKTSGIVWEAQHLDQWLANPRTYLPGTKMSFVGIKGAKDRSDLIAYLMVETGHTPR